MTVTLKVTAWKTVKFLWQSPIIPYSIIQNLKVVGQTNLDITNTTNKILLSNKTKYSADNEIGFGVTIRPTIFWLKLILHLPTMLKNILDELWNNLLIHS